MEDMARQEQDFGKDHGLIHEVVVTGRKVGAGRDFWSALAHNEQLFGEIVGLVNTRLTSLLEKLGTIVVPANNTFLVRDKFAVGERPKIVFVSNHFKEWFGDKMEGARLEKTELCYSELKKPSLDQPILDELGDKAEINLAQVYALLEHQPKGENGVLLTNGRANIFYVRDINGTLRAVSVLWRGDGWSLHALSVENPLRWYDGDWVFSRNS